MSASHPSIQTQIRSPATSTSSSWPIPSYTPKYSLSSPGLCPGVSSDWNSSQGWCPGANLTRCSPSLIKQTTPDFHHFMLPSVRVNLSFEIIHGDHSDRFFFMWNILDKCCKLLKRKGNDLFPEHCFLFLPETS